jgi:hypothetical protein
MAHQLICIKYNCCLSDVYLKVKCIMWRMVLVLLLTGLRSKTSTICHTIHSASWWWTTYGPETYWHGNTIKWQNSASCWFIVQTLKTINQLLHHDNCLLLELCTATACCSVEVLKSNKLYHVELHTVEHNDYFIISTTYTVLTGGWVARSI